MQDRNTWNLKRLASQTAGCPSKIALCCLWAVDGSPRLQRIVRPDGSIRVSEANLIRCNRTSCPVCHAGWVADRMDDLLPILREYSKMGGIVRHATLTMRHDAGMPLSESLKVLTESWRRFAAVAFKGQPRVLPRVPEMRGRPWLRVIQITHGRSGWHPHLHVLLLLPPGEQPRPDLHGRLSRAWIESVSHVAQREGGSELRDRTRPTMDNAIRLTEHEDGGVIGAYVVGAMELIDDRGKSASLLAKTPGKTPLQLLEHPATRHLWAEYARVIQGRRLLQWGGLKSPKSSLLAILRDAGYAPDPLPRPEPHRVDEIAIHPDDWQWIATSIDDETCQLDSLLPILADSVESALAWLIERGWRAERVTAAGLQYDRQPVSDEAAAAMDARLDAICEASANAYAAAREAAP